MNKVFRVLAISYCVLFSVIVLVLNITTFAGGMESFLGLTLVFPIITLVALIRGKFIPLPIIIVGLVAIGFILKDAHMFSSVKYVALGFYIIFGPMVAFHVQALIQRFKHGGLPET